MGKLTCQRNPKDGFHPAACAVKHQKYGVDLMGYSGANIGISQSIFFGLYVFAEYVMPRLRKKHPGVQLFGMLYHVGNPMP